MVLNFQCLVMLKLIEQKTIIIRAPKLVVMLTVMARMVRFPSPITMQNAMQSAMQNAMQNTENQALF